MRKVTMRVPPKGTDFNGLYLTFVVHLRDGEDPVRKIVEMLNENKDEEGAIRIDLSYGLISGRLFIADQFAVEASIVSIEDDDLGDF